MHSNCSPKITVIGGGSIMWTPKLLNDFSLFNSLKEAAFVLHDIDESAVDRFLPYENVINSDRKSNLKLIKEMNRKKALEGADFVVLQITTGGLDAMRFDLDIPLKYGIRQPVGDTIGPGGISRAFRNIPVILEIARDMEEVCPDAWLFNLTNPMTVICRAINGLTSIKTLGLCHELGYVINEFLAPELGHEKSDFEVHACGVNHFLWIQGLSIAGKDGFELLDRWLENNWRNDHAVKLNLYRDFGALPACGDRHIVEFFPKFLTKEPNYGAKYGVKLTTIEGRYQWFEDYRKEYMDWLNGDVPLPAEPSLEQTAHIINSFLCSERGRYVVNIPNNGVLPFLPDEAVVEVMAEIDSDGVHPEKPEQVKEGIAGMLSRIVYEQELTFQAAVEGDYQKAFQAMLMDPAIHGYEMSKMILDELIEAHRALLPQFS